MNPKIFHTPVMLEESLQGLAIQPTGTYIDATFGQGGHSLALLQRLGPQGQLLGFDRDPTAASIAKANLAHENRFSFEPSPFSSLLVAIEKRQWQGKVNGILFDLGVNSEQLGDPDRGFSFNLDGPLDMRMDPKHGEPVFEWLSRVKEEELAWVLKEYGEERYAYRIARGVVAARQKSPILRTKELVSIICAAKPVHERHKHPATRCFQALRIWINQELEELKQGLVQSLQVLAPGGRLVVISFHSLEDRIVKHFIRDAKIAGYVKIVAKLKPSLEEVKQNIRARSALLRVAEKI